MKYFCTIVLLCLFFSAGVQAQTQNDKLRFGASGPEVAQLLQTHKAEISRVAQRLGLRESTLLEIARELGIRNPKMTAEQFVQQIRKRAGDAVKLREKVVGLETEISQLKDRDLKSKADALIERFFLAFDEGRLDDAELQLSSLRALQDKAAAEGRLGLKQAVNLEAQFALSRGDFDKSAEKYSEARRQIKSQNREDLRSLAFEEAFVHMEKGDALGDAAAYRKALTIFENELLPDTQKDNEPDKWAAIQGNIATMQIVLTDYSGESFDLDQLLMRFDNALAVVSPSINKRLWSVLLRQKARALQSAGNRQADSELLLRAAQAYEESIASYGRDEDAELWGQTQFFIGDLYLQVAARSSDLTYLEKSKAAFELSLQTRTQQSSPLYWAESKIALANSYWIQGAVGFDHDALQAGLDLLDESLQVLEAKRDPTLWGESFNIRGMIFLSAGERQNGIKLLELAVESFGHALEARKKDANPGKWAETMNGVGVAQNLMAQRSGDNENWRLAEDAFRGALTVWTITAYPSQYAMAKSALGGMLMLQGKQKNDLRLMDAALVELLDAGKIWTIEDMPRGWATNQNVIASIYHHRGKLGRNKAELNRAIAAFDASWKEFTRQGNSGEKLRVTINKNAAIADLALITKDRSVLNAALAELARCNEEAIAANVEILQLRIKHERARILAEAKELGLN